jgi:hypothetical protein
MFCFTRRVLIFGAITILALPASSQKNEGQKFAIRIDEIDRLGQTCTLSATTEKITYKLMARVSNACTWLSAGNEYKAYRTTLTNPNNAEYESPVITILKDIDKQPGVDAAFDILSERTVKRGNCPSDDPVSPH